MSERTTNDDANQLIRARWRRRTVVIETPVPETNRGMGDWIRQEAHRGQVAATPEEMLEPKETERA